MADTKTVRVRVFRGGGGFGGPKEAQVKDVPADSVPPGTVTVDSSTPLSDWGPYVPEWFQPSVPTKSAATIGPDTAVKGA